MIKDHNITELKKACSQGKRLKYIFFWGHRPKSNGKVDKSCLSQWWPAKFNVDGVEYNSAEQWMMAEKARLFKDLKNYQRIIEAKSPNQAKKIGREVVGFDQEIWEKNRFDIVVKGNYYKFNQNEELKEYLVSTQKRILVEASPVDKIWGIGLSQDHPDVENPSKWKGINLLGFALMAAREKIINNDKL